MAYTPINYFKLSRASQDFLKQCEKFKRFKVKNIHVPAEIFSELRESISASDRNDYTDSIPYEGKILVRR